MTVTALSLLCAIFFSLDLGLCWRNWIQNKKTLGYSHLIVFGCWINYMMDTLKSSVVLIQYQDYLPSSHRLISITLVTCNTSNFKATGSGSQEKSTGAYAKAWMAPINPCWEGKVRLHQYKICLLFNVIMIVKMCSGIGHILIDILCYV